MKTASFVGVILPQTPVHLVQILYSILQWVDFNPGTLTFNPNSMKISNWTTNVANQTKNDLDWPGFTHFVAKTYQSQITCFWAKIWTQIFVCVKDLTFRNSAQDIPRYPQDIPQISPWYLIWSGQYWRVLNSIEHINVAGQDWLNWISELLE